MERLLEKRTQEVENLTGFYRIFMLKILSFSHRIVQSVSAGFQFKLKILFCAFTEDVKRLNEKLTETNKVKMELQLKLDDIQSSAASVEVQIRF